MPLSQQNRPRPPFGDMRRTGQALVRRLTVETHLKDEARFLKSWFDKPLVTGAVSPSGKALAKMMAHYVDPALPGAVIEIGPGTGPVTEALVKRGVSEDRLILLEFNPDFCRLLRRRFPKARVIEGDAYALDVTLADLGAPAAAVISSLPLFTKSEELRLGLLRTAFNMMHPGCPFIQFTYATVSPMPTRGQTFEARVSPRVWLNLPPARVWVYRRHKA